MLREVDVCVPCVAIWLAAWSKRSGSSPELVRRRWDARQPDSRARSEPFRSRDSRPSVERGCAVRLNATCTHTTHHEEGRDARQMYAGVSRARTEKYGKYIRHEAVWWLDARPVGMLCAQLLVVPPARVRIAIGNGQRPKRPKAKHTDSRLQKSILPTLFTILKRCETPYNES